MGLHYVVTFSLPLLYSLQKSLCGEYFNQTVGIFFCFLEHDPPKSEVLGFNIKSVFVDASLHKQLHTIFFTQKVMDLKNVNL